MPYILICHCKSQLEAMNMIFNQKEKNEQLKKPSCQHFVTGLYLITGNKPEEIYLNLWYIMTCGMLAIQSD